MGGRTREEDFIDHLFVASTHHTLLFFTEKGRCYWLPVHRIPETDRTGKGRAIQNLIQLPQDDKIRAIIDVPSLEDKEYVNKHSIVLCTKGGIIKKTSLADFSRPRANGVNAITITEGDQLLDVSLTDGNSYIMMAVKSGRAICFPEDRVRRTGRGAIGVYGIDMEEGKDEVIGMICIPKDDTSKYILVVSEKGLGKRTCFLERVDSNVTNTADTETGDGEVTPEIQEGAEDLAVSHLDTLGDGSRSDSDANTVSVPSAAGEPIRYEISYRVTNRGGKGVKTMNVTEKTGGLVGFLAVEKTDDLMITCRSGVTIRMRVADIREAGRATQGVRLINLDEGDSIAAIARIEEQEVQGEGDVEAAHIVDIN
jgi:DNA gyrase subunit A